MRTSTFDLFKIGVGPSSSHTVGPMRAAARFAGLYPAAHRMVGELYGSLALTGVGHATDRAVLLGLSGEMPDTVDPGAMEALLHRIEQEGRFSVVFHRDQTLPAHPNGMRFTALDAAGATLGAKVYYSIGGGFIREEGEEVAQTTAGAVPHPFSSGAELLDRAQSAGLPIWQLMFRNETTWRSEAEVRAGVLRFWTAMKECTWRGLHTEGILPGGLNVRRRAPRLYEKLVHGGSKDPLAVMDWVNVYAMAVNEENAAGGRVVTAPTNGAAGVIPAVAHYYLEYMSGDSEGILRYFLTAAAIGVLYKENASISGAEVGCQGEVGVACSMAAAGLVGALDGTAEQVEHAAEIGMEHNLGMTCDPIGGLVQIPCIERNAIGAVKAINAARMSLQETEGHKVSLDQVIRTMYQTGLDMQSKYKETSLAGLAVLAVSRVEC
ncbi:MAG: L-serine ammonia-lyase [Acidobacteria bacterium]|nr:L-serine ammonia-lyase [Acidobacteriota bacterium]